MNYRRTSTVTVLAALALLGGCDKGGVSVKDKSPEEVARAMPDSVRPLPGLYATRAEVIDVAMPGLDPAMVAQMKQAMARSMEDNRFCLTAEQAEKGYEERLKQLTAKPDCTFEHYDLAAGKLDAKLVCKGAEGMNASMALKGTVAPDGSDLTMITQQSGGPAAAQMHGGGMTMTMRVRTTRVGDCPADGAAK